MAAPTRPRNSNPFMAMSPYPSAHRYLGLNVHDFNLTPAEFSSPHGHGGIRAVVCGKRTHTSAGVHWHCWTRMSAMAHEQTSRQPRPVRCFPQKQTFVSTSGTVRLVPIADIEHQAQPLLRCRAISVTSFGASSPTCVSKRCRILWPSSSRTSRWWASTYSSHLWPVVGDALTIMRYSFYNDVEALLRRY